ncbi:MAG: methionine--tRNA ligase subunit beta, partial [Thermoanaerobaculia bacterium]
VATGLLPFMPRTAPRVLASIGVPEAPAALEAMAWGGLPTEVQLPEPEALFPRIDKAAYVEEAEAEAAEGQAEGETMITIDQFFETELRVATVRAAEPVPKSNKLLKVTVDLGGETRTVVAGIAKVYEPDALVGKQVVVVANLQPAKLMGVESQGMILAADVEGRPILLHPAEEVPNGSRVR